MQAKALNLKSESMRELLEARMEAAVFKFDANDLLLATEGNCSAYVEKGASLNTSTNAYEILPFLVGMDLLTAKELFYVEALPGVVVDIYISPQSYGYDVVMLNSGVQRERHQMIQQVANDVSLQRDDLEDENEELSEKNKTKSKFISTFSHELKTPLASILGYSELLLGNMKDFTAEQHADAIHRNGIYLLNLINNVLEQGRSEIRQISIATKDTELQDILNSVNYMVKPLAAKKSLEYSVHVACAEDLVLPIDKQHLSQVLVNLISNSIKFSESGVITLEVDHSNDMLQFVVTDTGIGIPRDELDNIMKPFGRAKHTQHIEGAGIGLSLSNKLVEMMGGSLNIQSKLGEGTTVTVSVPAKESMVNMPNLNEPVTASQIVIAEDDTDIIPLIRLYLEGDGHETVVATSPDEVLKALEADQPSLILMDHNLKDENGIELTKQILADGYQGKIIMLTATSGEAIVKQAYAAGCVDFITKPIDRETLLRQVREQIS